MRARAGLLLAIVLATTGVASAAPPSNDDLAAAAPITIGEYLVIVNEDATMEAEENDAPSCIGDGLIGRTTWYRVTPARDGFLASYLLGTFTPVFVTYSGAGYGSLVEVGCEAPGPVIGPDLTTPAHVRAGETYLLQIGGWNSDPGTIEGSIELYDEDPNDRRLTLANDDIADALPIDLPFEADGIRPFGATLHQREVDACPETYEDAASLWLRFTPAVSGRITTTAWGGSGYVRANLFTGTSYDDLRTISCAPYSSDYPFDAPVIAGTSYLIQLYAEVYDDTDEVYLSVDGVFTRPANDDRADTTEFTFASTAQTSVTWAATLEADEPIPACRVASLAASTGKYRLRSSVWYRIPTGVSGEVTVASWGSNFSVALGAYMVVGDDLVEVGCSPSSIVGDDITFVAVAGRTYLVQAMGLEDLDPYFPSSRGAGTLRITMT